MSNLKDTITNYCAIAFVVGGAILGLPSLFQQYGVTLALPTFVTVTGGLLCAISTAVTMILTGKNPDGSKKDVPPTDPKP